ncbi:probable glutathione S-transferase [Humulus lupulus]|uniref:probable glutathione S-transferase n=1 Tax=Humulus lupulus TaxID=3486 RepID=UPI002B4010F4|nr:probable glutathione S-transferase [Humulus lupulus]
MGDDEVVKLHGHWASPFSARVLWALNLKGIPFEFITEDLPNKSELLLQYNPVHKKIPVLVHGGKPICESMVIIEYIEDTWPHTPTLLPKDPYDRALARFWVQFAELKGPSIWMVFRSLGEEQEKAKKESVEMLRRIEELCSEKIKGDNDDNKFFGGEEIGILDIAFGGMIVEWYDVIEEIVGVKLFEPQQFPHLHQWVKHFKQVPVVKQNLPSHHDLLLFFKAIRQNLIPST